MRGSPAFQCSGAGPFAVRHASRSIARSTRHASRCHFTWYAGSQSGIDKATARDGPHPHYYTQHAAEFFHSTVGVDMAPIRQRFIARLPPGGHILDAGCGSGRDARAFAEAGFRVTAFDASAELARLASAHCGFAVAERRFEDVDEVAQFDGIWCCASLLHVPLAAVPDPGAAVDRAAPRRHAVCQLQARHRRAHFTAGAASPMPTRPSCGVVRPDARGAPARRVADRRPAAGPQHRTLDQCAGHAPARAGPAATTAGDGRRRRPLPAPPVASLHLGHADGPGRRVHQDHGPAAADARPGVDGRGRRAAARARAHQRLPRHHRPRGAAPAAAVAGAGRRGARLHHGKEGSSFHLKAYLFARLDGSCWSGTAFIGSSNISRQALQDGLEWNYRVVYPGDAGFSKRDSVSRRCSATRRRWRCPTPGSRPTSSGGSRRRDRSRRAAMNRRRRPSRRRSSTTRWQH
jgi:hypothetical protein